MFENKCLRYIELDKFCYLVSIIFDITDCEIFSLLCYKSCNDKIDNSYLSVTYYRFLNIIHCLFQISVKQISVLHIHNTFIYMIR